MQKLNNSHSLFLFGARGTGKSTLLRRYFGGKDTLWIDLLTEADDERYGQHPAELALALAAKKFKCVVIDEIQKAPKLLDIVHSEIERDKKIQFVLTGSSARKLKRGSANLLAGRAYTYTLHPLTYFELAEKFELDRVLNYGTLPELYSDSPADPSEYLRAYAKTYLKEEIQIEQAVRRIDPFRNFLEVAAQMNGKVLNYSGIARDVGVSDKSVHQYYQILEDTLIGFHLESFHRSVRKRQRVAPKFYFFDLGVVRALNRTLRTIILPRTPAYGDAFEHFLICEAERLNEYLKMDFRLSYLLTKDDAEIDLIIERPGELELLVEIKSKNQIASIDCQKIDSFSKTWDRKCEAQVWSTDPVEKKVGSVVCLHWQEALKRLFQL